MSIQETIIETNQGGIKIIQYNKPKKKNAIDGVMYRRVISILNDAATDDSVSVMVLTGTGDFYSSGNDFSAPKDPHDDTGKHLNLLKDYIKAFIMFPKILVAVVNGPAIGIAATTLALCDLVFASESAMEMLLCNYKMPAKEALEYGFINYVYKPEELQSKVWDKITEVSMLPSYTVTATKKLLRDRVREELLQANEKEMEQLNIIWAKGYRSKL
ncbi:hypothetical protein HF086_014548 [Spodoptera exigua]|uniref:Uncharacterized protein n=1 Tax=Spodoptera exigua TaxID=7107 RepID=A0A922SCP0_SPOEX|nr:hypothetical protein HF086_014548 [Spodoptera exigua]